MAVCPENYSSTFRTKIGKEEKEIFIGAVDENGVPRESPCNLKSEYDKCRLYLDGLTKMDKLIIYFYTKGSISTVISAYKRKLILGGKSLNISSQKHVVYDTITTLILYRRSLNIEENDFYKQYFDKIINYILNNFVKIIEELIINPSVTEILENYNFDLDNDIKKLDEIKNKFVKLTTNDKFKLFIDIIKEEEDDFIISLYFYLYDEYFDKMDNEDYVMYIEQIIRDLNRIVDNTPSIEREIRLYRSASHYKDYEIGHIITNEMITSTSCSQKTNIATFSQEPDGCCIAELIIKPGTHALFLNYEETAYGEAMYEVILQSNINFAVCRIEKKNIIRLDKDYIPISSDYLLKKFFDVKYKPIDEFSVKNVNIYLLKQI
mgnify:CR=1 FL=1